MGSQLYCPFAQSIAKTTLSLVHRYDAKIKSLYKLPERINFKEKSKTEEMLSNQMLSGIPEVDLGIE